MKVLIGCERSGIVRDAFLRMGHDAYSCDLVPTEVSGPHIVGDVLTVMHSGWDMMIAFPDCTYVCGSGLHWNRRRPERQAMTDAAVEFFRKLLEAPVDKIALENPIGCLSTRIRKPDQIIQPWQFGDDASKATCLWLKGLPPLVPTKVLPGGRQARRANQTPSGQNKLGPSPTRHIDRARTYPGIASAMAIQWVTADRPAKGASDGADV